MRKSASSSLNFYPLKNLLITWIRGLHHLRLPPCRVTRQEKVLEVPHQISESLVSKFKTRKIVVNVSFFRFLHMSSRSWSSLAVCGPHVNTQFPSCFQESEYLNCANNSFKRATIWTHAHVQPTQFGTHHNMKEMPQIECMDYTFLCLRVFMSC